MSNFKDMPGQAPNVGALFDIPTGTYVESKFPERNPSQVMSSSAEGVYPVPRSALEEFTGIPDLDKKKHYYARHPLQEGKEYDLITTFTDHYEMPIFEPTFCSILAQWPLFEKYNIPKTDEWFETLIRFGEEVLANDNGDHDQDIRVTKILEWARAEISGELTNTPFPEQLFIEQLHDTRFLPLFVDSLSQMEQESRSASKSLMQVRQFDQPKPVKKKKKRKGSNRATASRNTSVGSSMMALLAKGTTVDPEQGVGLNSMIKRLERESKSFEERVKAAGLNLPDVSKGETLESVNPGTDLSEFQ